MLPVDDLGCVKKVMTELDDLRIGRKRHSCLVVSPPTFEMQDVGSIEILQSVCESPSSSRFLYCHLPPDGSRITLQTLHLVALSFNKWQAR